MGEAPKWPPKSEKSGDALKVLSLSFASSQFSLWRLRFKALCRERNADLAALFEPAAKDAGTDRPLLDAFSAQLIPFVGDDVLEYFQHVADVEKSPLLFFSLLTKHFASLTPLEDSNVERFYSSLRARRNQFPSLSAFIGHLQRALAFITSTYPGAGCATMHLLAERLLILQLTSSLNSAHWAHPLISSTKTKMRTDPREHISFSEFASSLLQACPFDPEVGASSSSSVSEGGAAAPRSSSHYRDPAATHGAFTRPQGLGQSPAARVSAVMTLHDEEAGILLSDANGLAHQDLFDPSLWHFHAE
jgi:hypothetical protein